MASPDLTAGMQAKGPYQQVGHDVDTGLPVMKRRDAQPMQQSKPAAQQPVGKLDAQRKTAETKPAGEKKYKFGNTQVNLPTGSDAHKAITSMQRKIPSEHKSDVHEDQEKPHVTVRYGLNDGDKSKLKDYISKQAPFDAKLGKTHAFPVSDHSEGAAPIVAPVESPDLHRMNKEMDKHGDFAPSSFPDYKPHVTVAYVKPEHAQKYTGMADGEGKTFKVNSIHVGDRDGNTEEVKLQGSKPALQPANGAKPKPMLKPAGPEQGKFTKGTAVQMADGTRGQVAYSDGKVARVKTEDGKNVSVKHHQITPMQEVKVRAHTRMVAKREDGDANGTAKTNGDSDMAPGDGPNPERQFTRASISRDAK